MLGVSVEIKLKLEWQGCNKTLKIFLNLALNQSVGLTECKHCVNPIDRLRARFENI